MQTIWSPRVRATTVMVMFCGFSIGAAVGGVVAASLMARYGWPAVFVAGGLFPCVLAVALFVGAVTMLKRLPGEFVPSQDQSRVMIRLQTAVGANLEETDALFRKAEAIVNDRPEVVRVMAQAICRLTILSVSAEKGSGSSSPHCGSSPSQRIVRPSRRGGCCARTAPTVPATCSSAAAART